MAKTPKKDPNFPMQGRLGGMGGKYGRKAVNLTAQELKAAGAKKAAAKRTVNISQTSRSTTGATRGKTLGPGGKPLTGSVKLLNGKTAVYKGGKRVMKAAPKPVVSRRPTAITPPPKPVIKPKPKGKSEDSLWGAAKPVSPSKPSLYQTGRGTTSFRPLGGGDFNAPKPPRSYPGVTNVGRGAHAQPVTGAAGKIIILKSRLSAAKATQSANAAKKADAKTKAAQAAKDAATIKALEAAIRAAGG